MHSTESQSSKEVTKTSNQQSPKLKRVKIQNVDIIIAKILNQKKSNQVQLSGQQIKTVCQACRSHFLSQSALLKLQSPLKIVGDIHGQLPDLLKIFQKHGLPGSIRYIFLGDYVDRGKQSIETIMLLFSLVLKYPDSIFLLRGNHQSAEVNKLYGFFDECKRKYNVGIWKVFVDSFNCLPISALVEDKILCMHGGISPQLNRLKKLEQINRPTEVPPSGLLCDLLWADPNEEQKGWRDNNERGISKLFGTDVLEKFLQNNDLDLICRAHQIVEEGYQFFGKKQLVTIFSAPNYCGMFENSGAIMNVGEGLVCSFDILESQGVQEKKSKRKKLPRFIN